MHVKGTFPPYNAKMPPQVLHITAVPTEQGILSAFAASILAWLHPPSRLPGYDRQKRRSIFDRLFLIFAIILHEL